ncbi:helix-turn-helix domain-containing protein [Prevotella nigrescens]|nr:DNA binding domain protein [Prevotella nigrescens ATCC 33563]UAK28447.1 helix-turn-helix domain-containing protein [Prevotella nigrescens]
MYRVSVGTMLCDHRRSFATLLGKEVCERLHISPHTLQDYRDKRIIPYKQFAGKILYKASDLERLLEESYSA